METPRSRAVVAMLRDAKNLLYMSRNRKTVANINRAIGILQATDYLLGTIERPDIATEVGKIRIGVCGFLAMPGLQLRIEAKNVRWALETSLQNGRGMYMNQAKQAHFRLDEIITTIEEHQR